jgi:HPt (histidine-containing phosphotransfer) domain-containing protein
MTGAMTARLLPGYLLGQALILAVVPFNPVEGWGRVLCQVLAGWLAAAFVVVGVRVHRPQGPAAYYFFGGSVFLNATGILVEAILGRFFQIEDSPNLADLFWLSVYPGLVIGITLLVRRRRARDWTMAVDTAIITVGLSLLAWVFVIRAAAARADHGLLAAVVVTAYPVADVVVLAMMIRLVLGGGGGNTAFRLMVASLLSLLAGDLGWTISTALGVSPGPLAHKALLMVFQVAYALTGAAALHPSVSEPARPAQRPVGLTPFLLAGLTTASLIAPAVLLLQTLRHRITDGLAIAVTSTALFLLVVVRMTQLLRRLGERTRELDERNRATRLVLDTVDQGLLRVADDGRLAEERSAMIDRWFGPFTGRPLLADYLGPIDALFADSFSLGHETLREGLMPSAVCLAQLPARLRSRDGRALAVSYLRVAGERGNLLLVIDDVSETLRLARQEAEQRELLALFQGWTRDRAGLVALIDEATRLIERAALPDEDLVVRRRCMHTVKGSAGQAGFNVVRELCHAAEDELDELGGGPPGPALQAVQGRWTRLTDTLASLTGDGSREVVTVRSAEIDSLCHDLVRGLSTSETVQRLASWRCEPAEQALERLARHARTLARTLDKGDLEVEVEASGLRLDHQRWGPLWTELVHVINNAVDHGLERADERREAGKPPRPRLRLAAALGEHRLVITIEDDGRGIDWSAIARSAARAGLPAATAAELTSALLSAGVSSRSEVSLLSGRGVGMAAVRARVEELHGEVTVSSRTGAGTCWRFSFPLSTLGAHEGAGADPRLAAGAHRVTGVL